MTKRTATHPHSQSPRPAAPQRDASRAPLFPSLGQILDPRGPVLVPLLLLLTTRIVLWIVVPLGAEDAYITYRYSHHLAGGQGLQYNPGERVMGFSSPLWVVWNALGYALLHQPLLWSRMTALCADVVTLLTMTAMLSRFPSRAPAWCFNFFFAVWPYFPAVAISGMENSLMLALIPLSAALLEARSVAGGVSLAALALTRPEGLVAAAFLALGARWRERAVSLVLVGIGYGALAVYFGTILPQSVVAKAMTYGTPGPWAGRVWWEWLLPFRLGHWPEQGDTVLLVPLSAVMAPALILGVRELWNARETALARALAATLIVWIGYSALGVAYFWWYLAVPLAGIAGVAAVGLPRVTRGPALYVTAMLIVLGVWTIAPSVYLGRAEGEARTFGVAVDYLRAHVRPGEKAMLEPIGMIGYEIPAVIVDEVGLVSPRVAARRRQGPGWYSDIVTAERPDWLVLRYGVLRTGDAFAGQGAPFRTQAERDTLLAMYQVMDQGEGPLEDNSLVILKRAR